MMYKLEPQVGQVVSPDYTQAFYERYHRCQDGHDLADLEQWIIELARLKRQMEMDDINGVYRPFIYEWGAINYMLDAVIELYDKETIRGWPY